MDATIQFRPGDLVRARGREWVVLPETRAQLLRLRPLGGSDDDAALIYLPLEPEAPKAAVFDYPDPTRPGSQAAVLLLRDALRLKLRAGAGPFRSFGNLAVEPRAYQLVPLLMALKLDPVRLLIADDVGIGKTIEAGLIARELLDRGEIERVSVICPPHLCEQWQTELADKFNIQAEIVRTGTADRLERGLSPSESIFDVYPFTIVSLDYIKSDRRRDDFLRAAPNFIIIDEAHTCVQPNTATRHQRYRLVQGLANERPDRHLLLLTATPHSGDDVAFHNLLGLLSPQFSELLDLPEGKQRAAIRSELANHFVQRRRGDLAEWKDQRGLPARETAEVTYQLTGPWGELFDDILKYARTLVVRAEGGSVLQQRMSWWAALALLRCSSSSPAAATLALSTRLQVTANDAIDGQITEVDRIGADTVLDGESDDILSLNESVPAGTVESAEDTAALRALIHRADQLRGPAHDSKLALLVREVRRLLADGFKPVIFCRYIATAHYVADQLKQALAAAGCYVTAVTGEITPAERQANIERLLELEEAITPILVATDCLSEGVNLQKLFNAVIHYDLTWNPTRHEQREGRADRFGQSAPVVRTIMLYGVNNPVDGAVLRVILRKAAKIRQELGVAVPVPTDSNKVVEAIMKAVLLQSEGGSARQLRFDFSDEDTAMETAWSIAKNQTSRTIFAQSGLVPDEVLPEWNKSADFLGQEADVERFVEMAAQELGAPLEIQDGYYRFPIRHLPRPLQEQLEATGYTGSVRLAFRHPAPLGAQLVHRTHPLVSMLADYIAEAALENQELGTAARCGAIFTRQVSQRVTVFLLRLRSQLTVQSRGGADGSPQQRVLFAEECLGVAVRGNGQPEILTGTDAFTLMSAGPGRNMASEQQTRLIEEVLAQMPGLAPAFRQIAHERADILLADHKRVRDAGKTKGINYSVSPALPVDIISIFVLVPMIDM